MHTTLIQQTITDFFENFPMSIESVDQSHDDDIDLDIFTLKFSEYTKELMGVGGETLRMINYLIRKIVEQKLSTTEDATPNFLIDISGHYIDHIDSLKAKASILAERARSFKNSTALEPMTAYDRLIVHSYLSKQPNIKTESAGEGRDRHIVVQYIEVEAESDLVSI
jgi:spoIIIJ-associated protein